MKRCCIFALLLLWLAPPMAYSQAQGNEPCVDEQPLDAYHRIQNALTEYEDLARRDDGEQLPVPQKSIKVGERYPGVPRLTRLLRLLGDLPPGAATDPEVYDRALAQATRHFQRRHGLDPDGRLGRETITELNVPLAKRVMQLRLALERWNMLPHDVAGRQIMVNIPEFALRAWDEQHHLELHMKIVAGKAYRRRTPTLSSEMTSVTFRPYWNVPLSIQVHELLPKIKKDPDYLAKNDFEVVNQKGQVMDADVTRADVQRQIQSGELSIRQRPGPKNSLGAVKFTFPNPYDIYMHDTPAKELFQRSRRDFSHGCIRVEDALALAVWALKENPDWGEDRIEAAMKGERTFQVTLAAPIPVMVIYGTAAVAENGDVHFFRDIYGYDAELEQKLADKPSQESLPAKDYQ